MKAAEREREEAEVRLAMIDASILARHRANDLETVARLQHVRRAFQDTLREADAAVWRAGGKRRRRHLSA